MTYSNFLHQIDESTFCHLRKKKIHFLGQINFISILFKYKIEKKQDSEDEEDDDDDVMVSRKKIEEPVDPIARESMLN